MKDHADSNSAVEMTKLAYGDEQGTRNLDFRVKCADIDDLGKCCKVIEGYNEFEWVNVMEAIRDNLAPDVDGMDFYIGREGSVAMYIRFGFFYFDNNNIKVDDDRMGQSKVMELIKKQSKADECHHMRLGEWRLWWD